MRTHLVEQPAAAGSPDCPVGQGTSGSGGSMNPPDPPHGQHGWYGNNGCGSGGAVPSTVQHAGGYPSWYAGGGESIAGRSAFNPHNGYVIHGADMHGTAAGDWQASGMSRHAWDRRQQEHLVTYSGESIGGGSGITGAFSLHNGYASYGADTHGIAGDRHAAGMSLGSVSYGGAAASGDGWYCDGDRNAMNWRAPSYGTSFFYENGLGRGTPSAHVYAGMYQPQHAKTGYWIAGGSNGVVDRRSEFLPGNGSSSFPLPRNPNVMHENQHARAYHWNTGVGGSAAVHRFDVLHGNGEGETFASPHTGARMHVPPYYTPNGRRPGSPRQWYMEEVNHLIADALREFTIRGGGSRLPDLLNDGQALVNTGYQDFPSSSASGGRGLWNADPYVGMRLEDVRGRMIRIAGDSRGCRFLARMVDNGGAAAARQVFDEVAGEVVRFMGDSVAYIVVEKLAMFWTDEETMTRVLGFLGAASPAQILAAAKNHAGSNILQTLTDRIAGQPEQVESFTRTLAGVGDSGVLSLIEEIPSSLLILKCLERFSADQNQFIIDVALNFSHRVCIDKQGCNVFNRCIDKAGDGETRSSLIAAVCRDGLSLAEHGAGNYVVQHVIKVVPGAKDGLHRSFRGRYVSLSRQTAGSHVVQRCLEYFSARQADEIVWELLNCERHCGFRFHELICDPYANYVLQTAMRRKGGRMHSVLVHTIDSYSHILEPDTSAVVNRFAKQVFHKLRILTRTLDQ